MTSKIFLDANVVLEFILKRKYFNTVEPIFKIIEVSKYKAFISTSVLEICSYWISKSYGTGRAKIILLNMLNYVSIIDCKQDVVIMALNSAINDIEDSLQYYTALSHKMDYFLTFDKELLNSAIPELPIYKPEDFLNL